VVGQGNAADYAVAMQALLQEYFQLRMTDAERKQVLTRVVRTLNATVNGERLPPLGRLVSLPGH